MSEFYGDRNDVASLAILRAAFEFGYRAFDTADFYGAGHNEQLLGTFLADIRGRRDQIALASKSGLRRAENGTVVVDSSPDYLRAACEHSLRRLRTEYIDLYYLHRRDPQVPIEDSVGALADLIRAGKVRAIGLSEVSATTLRRAASVHPIAALQSEYSLWTRDVEDEILDVCQELDIALVAYSPLGRGFLGGDVRADTSLGEADLRHRLPRFQPANLRANESLLTPLRTIAVELAVHPAQVALAWLLAQKECICAVPGSRKVEHLKANFDALDVALSRTQLEQLTTAFSADRVSGARYPAELLRLVNV